MNDMVDDEDGGDPPHQPQRHTWLGFAVGAYSPPPRPAAQVPSAAAPSSAQAPAVEWPPGVVRSAPALVIGFLLWVAAWLFGRLSHHQALVFARDGGVTDDGTTASVVRYVCVVVGALFLAVGIWAMASLVDHVARDRHLRAHPSPAPTVPEDGESGRP